MQNWEDINELALPDPATYIGKVRNRINQIMEDDTETTNGQSMRFTYPLGVKWTKLRCPGGL